MKEINEVLSQYHIKKNTIFNYGKYIAKIDAINKHKKNAKLVLVTAITPTSSGEGKTTVSIGLSDALNEIGFKSIVALREPSMGPVFGVKGGAHGGGKSQVIPNEEIDLNFTGDFHAITAANNLISAVIDNEIYFNSKLNIDHKKIIWKRCLDVNDRSLRNVIVELRNVNKVDVSYHTGFNITAASEIMAIFCLAKDEFDFVNRINKIIVAFSKKNKPIYLKDLKITNAILKIMKQALNPNVVQTLNGNLAIVHGGPFANIAHGCSSVIGIKTAMSISDFTVTEAGFGSDLGAEKFFNIVCRENNFRPNCVVLTASIKSLKNHGSINEGLENLMHHWKIISSFSKNNVVALNKFANDSQKDIASFTNFCKKHNICYEIIDPFNAGSMGCKKLAKMVIEISKNKQSITNTYSMNDEITKKIIKVARDIYFAKDVNFSKEAKLKIAKIEKNKSFYPCICKTPLSFTDDPKDVKTNDNFTLHIKDIELNNGAGFVIAICNAIFRMPGLPEKPNCKD